MKLSRPEWEELARAHAARVKPWLAPRLERASRHIRHPVEDFLFEYYSQRPSHLLRWRPGFGVVLEKAGEEEFPPHRGYVAAEGGRTLGSLDERRKPSVEWILSLLEATADRAPSFGCHGLHEWAMVYRSAEVRHGDWPLRLPPDEIAAVVEALPIRCSHYDAFRFFTPAARPLNRLQPARESMLAFEQSGCLHANMDLYKWAGKLGEFTPASLLAETFELARDIRSLDMRASPYDLRALGYAPVCIETAEGRAEYEREQRTFAHRARPLRERLAEVCRRALNSLRVPAAAALAAVFLSSCATTPLPEDAEPLAGLMAERLLLAKEVAWAKWTAGLPVRDPERERRLLERISAQAELNGLDGTAASRFVRTQIEASCLEQERWMAAWKRGEPVPPGEPPTLEHIRIRLDALTLRLLAEWAATENSPVPPSAVRGRLIQSGISPPAAGAAAAGAAVRPVVL